jgi:hypothetical protein
MNQNFEFISYKSTPGDQYMIGIATVKLFGKVLVRFKHVKKKDGNGDFFAMQSYAITEDGQKKYLECVLLDSRSDEELLMDAVREGYRKSMQRQSVQEAPVFSQIPLSTNTNPSVFDPSMPF